MKKEARQATKADLRRGKRRCWSPPCRGIAWFEDWSGWHWCFKHMIREIKSNETSQGKWYEFINFKIRFPF